MKPIKSILNPESIRYEYTDSGFYDAGLLVFGFGQYETLGDGECKYTPTYRIGRERFTDFCMSVAAVLIADPEAKVYGHELGFTSIPQDAYDFLRSVKYQEDKRRYFSLQLRKMSACEDKRHDKRWQAVPSWAEGSAKSAFDLYWFCRESSGCLLERYAIFKAFQELSGGSFFQQDECEKWIAELSGDHCQAWRAMKSAHEAIESRQWASRLLDSAKFNTLPKQAEAQAA